MTEATKTRMLWLCGLMHGFTHVYHVALFPLYLGIKEDLGLADIDLATALVTLFGLTYFLPSYGIGILADRFNQKYLLTIGLLINGAGYVGLGLAPTYPWAVGFTLLAGLGGSFYHPTATALILRLFPLRAGKALGWVGVGAGIGFFVSPLYSGWRSEMAGWRAPVLELGAYGILAALAFAWLAIDISDSKPDPRSPSAPAASGRRATLFPSYSLWILFLLSCTAFSLRDFTGNGMGTLSSIFLQQAHDFNQSNTGIAISAIFLAAIISNPVFGRLSDRGRFPSIITALTIATLTVASFPWLPEAWLIPAFFAYGFFFMATYPMVEAALMEAIPSPIRGRIFGLFITIGGLVGTLAHWIIGIWIKGMRPMPSAPGDYFTIYITLAAFVLLSLTALPCLHVIRRRLKGHSSQEFS